MHLEFIKMTAQGNDYIYIDERKMRIKEDERESLARKLCDRRFGIGGDGLVFLQSCEEADIRMKMYNSNGSKGMMCGSALRSAVYLLSREIEQKEYLVKTDSGLRKGWLTKNDSSICVEIGKVKEYRKLNSAAGINTIVDIGNLHKVWIFDSLYQIDIKAIIDQEQSREGDKYNLEFVEVLSANEIKMQVFERGSGFTYACGTGAAASACTCIIEGRISGDKVKVQMPGGEVSIEYIDEELYLSGEVKLLYRGIIEDQDDIFIADSIGSK